MSQLGDILQTEPRTILGLLTEQMDAAADGPPRTRTRRTFKDRLGFIGIGCCGATWRFRSESITVRHEDQEQQQQPQQQRQQHQPLLLETNQARDPNRFGPDCVSPTPASSGMNLAAALAAERQLRGTPQEAEGGERRGAPRTPWRVSLMRLLEETDGGDAEVSSAAKTSDEDKISGGVGNDWVCCVCMGRKKGAAFIPCGHTFCRVCSRELWLNRGSCPLCNRSILEILDIF
ncbi:hypothetical protein HN51_003841 [Arachis hypogaea]|uniref:RING-type domain-containing protein n=1 Tax=Arachis hypogaea TaxID=3818 RepID=A0A445DJK8_ARAHY|nr:uncharacterized protein LOC112795959 [Arachis hypogaea]QHO37389.1 uncharacterized protein DS421_4g111050 [Arachis hypogaea]RYR63358.1 hypothetical protein Ahy_A04g021158 [Arachis hypogaea]